MLVESRAFGLSTAGEETQRGAWEVGATQSEVC